MRIQSRLLSPTNDISGQSQKKLRQVSAGEAFRTYYSIKHPGISVEALFAINALKKGRVGSGSGEKLKPIPWYIREIKVQNWVDENPQGQNLNGVKTTVFPLASGKTRLTITGPWAFKSFQALTGIATGKADDKGTSAGGLGIGLKESSRDLLEHRIIDNLTVIGEGWSVTYCIPPIEEVQETVAQKGIEPPEAYLVSELRELAPHEYEAGTCSYVIETDNQEFIDAFTKLKNIAPHEDHTALQNPDYHNRSILKKTRDGITQERPCDLKIKWLDRLDQRGDLFIQGQVWSHLSNVSTEEGYFKGAQGVTLELGSAGEFQHDADRSPLDERNFSKSLDVLIESMSAEDREAQLVKSFHLWSQYRDNQAYGKRAGAFILLENIVDKMRWDFENPFTLETLNALLPGNDFIAVSKNVTEEETKELRELGKTICPEFFKDLGIPLYQKDLRSQAKTESPNAMLAQYELNELRKTRGIPIDSLSLNIPANRHKAFFKQLQEQIRNTAIKLEKNPDGEFEFIFDQEVPVGLLTTMSFSGVKKKELLAKTQWLQALRNIIHWGLENKVLQNPNLEVQGYLATFDIRYDLETEKHNLFMKTSSAVSDPKGVAETEKQKFCFKLSDEDSRLFEKVFSFDQDGIWKPEYNPPPPAIEPKPKTPAQLQIEWALEAIKNGADPATTISQVQEALVMETEKILEEAKEEDSTTVEPVEVVATLPAKKSKLLLASTGIVTFAAATVAIVCFNFMDNLPNLDTKQPESASVVSTSSIGNTEKISPPDLLDKLTQEVNNTSASRGDSIEAYTYQNRKNETDKYANNGNTNEGITLDEFITNEQTAQVEANKEKELTEEQKRIEKLKTLLSSINNAAEDKIEDFEPLMYPNDLEKHKIELLKRFMYLATGIKQDYDLFIFEGKGALGVNMANKGGIGIHRALLKTPFQESLGTLSHELGHEKEQGSYAHGDQVFHTRLELLLTKTVGKLLKISNKPISDRTTEEKELLDIAKQWDELIPAKDPAQLIKTSK